MDQDRVEEEVEGVEEETNQTISSKDKDTLSVGGLDVLRSPKEVVNPFVGPMEWDLLVLTVPPKKENFLVLWHERVNDTFGPVVKSVEETSDGLLEDPTTMSIGPTLEGNHYQDY